MADIDMRRAHGLGLEGARAAADRMMENLAARFGLHGHWEGNVLRFQRPGVNGHLSVGADHLHLSVSLGFLFKAMRGAIESAVDRELDQVFARGDAPTPSAPAPDPDKSRR
ncbi:MAG: polyhydroxyalkanoic acid system family protein [Betaproteobacteria bacterium]